MNTLELIISPFIFLIKQIFLFSYSITGNYGLAIILLSFVISLMLLPIFILIEKAKKRDDKVKLKMKPLVDEIKRCYKGQERYYYLKTLNRQHNYSPLRALIPILSLLLQIPFFIAAYQFLEHFEPLTGVSFLFIKDLAEPDSLFGVINILPIAMTLVNLLTAYFYTRKGDSSERKQMLIVAGVFLVLLFNLPSGLVLYWTMNNVFSFFRLFITNREVFEKKENQHFIIPKSINKIKTLFNQEKILLKKTLVILLILNTLSQLNWAINNNFDTIIIRLMIAVVGGFVLTGLIGALIAFFQLYKSSILEFKLQPKFYYSILFLVIYFYLAGKYYFTGVNSSLIYIAALIVIPLQLIGLIYIVRGFKKMNPLIGRVTTFFLISIFITQLLNLIAFINNKEISFSLLNININVVSSNLLSFVLVGILFSIITLPFYIKQHNLNIQATSKSNWVIFLLAILYILGLVFFWNPLLVFSSSPETFDFPAIRIFTNNYILFIGALTIISLIYLVLPKKIKNIVLVFIVIIALITFFYSSIIPIDLGSLQVSRFSEQEKLAVPIYLYVLELFLIYAILFVVIIIRNKSYFKKAAITVLIILNILQITDSLYSVLKTDKFLINGQGYVDNFESNQLLSPISFSKNKQNIVFFIADGFQGWFVRKIMNDNPELESIFEGFTWYPNTISISNYTHSSMPSLLGGYDYSVSKMNDDNIHSIREKWYSSAHSFVEKIKSQEYIFNTDYQHYFNFEKPIVDNIIPLWDKSWHVYDKQLNLGNSHEIWYLRLSENAVFNSAPLFLKPMIYNNQKWLINTKKKTIPDYIFRWYNFLRLLPYISNTDSENKNFIYIHNSAAHNPWHKFTENGKLLRDVTPYENNRWYLNQLSKWVKWMKENEVYDNTKIVFISDHGASWYEYDGKPNFKSPLDENKYLKLDKEFFWRLNPLLMVKDFGKKGLMKTDWRLMSNADASSIIFDENNPTKSDSVNRILNTYWTIWASKMIDNKTMDVERHFEVSENIFNLENWKEISD